MSTQHRAYTFDTVSILVLVEVALEGFFRSMHNNAGSVSILVLVEVALEEHSRAGYRIPV